MAGMDEREIVIKTLRYVSAVPYSQEDLRDIADQLERDRALECCCPVCEEVRCDETCPLHDLRERNRAAELDEFRSGALEGDARNVGGSL
jgi:hypothetical protein